MIGLAEGAVETRAQCRFRSAALRRVAGGGHRRVAGLRAEKGLAPGIGGRQRRRHGAGVHWNERRTLLGRLPRQAVERQPQADWRVPGNQQQGVAAQFPAFADPARRRLPTLDRQHQAAGAVQARLEGAQHVLAAFGIGKAGIGGVEIVRQATLAQQRFNRVFVGLHGVFGIDPEALGDAARQARGAGDVGLAGHLARRQAPQRLTIAPPVDGPGPARQRLAGIPLALTVGQQPLRRQPLRQTLGKVVGEAFLGGAHGGRIPLVPLGVVERDEGGLAAHGQPHVLRHQVGVHLQAHLINGGPLRVGEGLGDARRFGDAVNLHHVIEGHLAGFDQTGDGRSRGG